MVSISNDDSEQADVFWSGLVWFAGIVESRSRERSEPGRTRGCKAVLCHGGTVLIFAPKSDQMAVKLCYSKRRRSENHFWRTSADFERDITLTMSLIRGFGGHGHPAACPCIPSVKLCDPVATRDLGTESGLPSTSVAPAVHDSRGTMITYFRSKAVAPVQCSFPIKKFQTH